MKTKLTEEQKQANREARKAEREAAKRAAEIAAERAQKPIKSLTVSIEWKKSRMWGNNPTATGRVEYADGTFGRTAEAKASGCGYDKESAVLANIFNQCLKYKLWELSDAAMKGGHGSMDHGPAPYGINNYNGHRSFAGGIGVSCYYEICKYLGGKFERVASGKTFDAYTATF